MLLPNIKDVEKRLWHEDEAFTEWARAMPDKYWAKYDLSAVRLGYELALMAMEERHDGHQNHGN